MKRRCLVLTILLCLAAIPALDPANIQFGCADWLWERQANSYALQVEPDRFKQEDKAVLPYDEALAVEKARDKVFHGLKMALEDGFL